MRIRSFWAKGFRSLVDVRLENLGDFNVFYGENGSGKSNLLAALDVLFRLVPAYFRPILNDRNPQPDWWEAVLTPHDLSLLSPNQPLTLEVELENARQGQPVFAFGALALPKLHVICEFTGVHGKSLRLQRFDVTDGANSVLQWSLPSLPPDAERNLLLFLVDVVGRQAFHLISADRNLRSEPATSPTEPRPDLLTLLDQGQLKRALNVAAIHPDLAVRKRLELLRTFLGGEPLNRDPFDPVQDPVTGEYGIQERITLANGEEVALPLDLVGLGVQQVYTVLAQALLGRTFVVGLEEPEAHLHAPTTGRALRTLLQRLVHEGAVKQLFIATHSNLFDLDPHRWYEVSRSPEGATVVTERHEPVELYAKHLYEPGPARRGLNDALGQLPDDSVVFRRPDGAPVTAAEMHRLLDADATEVSEWLRDVYRTAVRLVQVDAEDDEDEDEEGEGTDLPVDSIG